MSSTYTFDVDQFRLDFPAFADSDVYSDDLLNQKFNQATCYIANSNYGWLNGDCRYLALTLMTAHLTSLATFVKNNPVALPQSGLTSSATIDKITRALTAPPLKNQWQWFLMLTEYGQELYALLQVNAVGGLFIGGLSETAAFRRVGGLFI